jgi:hypothetical protein
MITLNVDVFMPILTLVFAVFSSEGNGQSTHGRAIRRIAGDKNGKKTAPMTNSVPPTAIGIMRDGVLPRSAAAAATVAAAAADASPIVTCVCCAGGGGDAAAAETATALFGHLSHTATPTPNAAASLLATDDHDETTPCRGALCAAMAEENGKGVARRAVLHVRLLEDDWDAIVAVW